MEKQEKNRVEITKVKELWISYNFVAGYYDDMGSFVCETKIENEHDLTEFMCLMHIKIDNYLNVDDFLSYIKYVAIIDTQRYEKVFNDQDIVILPFLNDSFTRYKKWAKKYESLRSMGKLEFANSIKNDTKLLIDNY